MRRRSQHTLFLMVLMLHSMCLKCELPFAWSKYIENQVEEISEDRLESLLTEIESLLERPVPIHDVEKQQLERLFFLITDKSKVWLIMFIVTAHWWMHVN